MIYLFLLLFASQLFSVTPSVIREKQVYRREKCLPLELNKTGSGNSDRNTSILSTIKQNLMEKWKCHGQEKSINIPGIRNITILTIALYGIVVPDDTQNDVRDVLPWETEDEADACRKVDMIVNFADLGLSDTIAFPWKFNAYQCKGRCSPTQRKKFVKRSLLMELIEEKKGIKIYGDACCVPTKMRGLSLVFFDNNEDLVKTDYNDMVVEECGCY